MSVQQLRADLEAHRSRISKLAVRGQSPDQLAAVVRVELSENVYPLLDAVLELLERDVLEPLADVGAAVDELIDQADEVIHGGTADAVYEALGAGDDVAKLLEAAVAEADDVTRQRATAAVEKFRRLAGEAVAVLTNITLEPQADGAGEEQADGGSDAQGEGEAPAEGADDEGGDVPDEEVTRG